MSTSTPDAVMPLADKVRVKGELLTVALRDGRTISAPLSWYPRLLHGNGRERANWRLIGRGQGIHWNDLDEDISVEGLLAGRASTESKVSFKRWLRARSSRSSKPAVRRTIRSR